jgi:adenine-specific DNA-methyltransferase
LNEAFVIDSERRAQLIADDPRSSNIIKPYLRGRDVKRWRVEPADLWLIFARHGIDIHEYPAVHSHLKTYKKSLMPRPASWDDSLRGPWPGRKAGSYEWYEIQDNVAYWNEFETPKIVLGRFMDEPTYAFDETGFYANNALSIVAGATPFLACVLNSTCSWWFLKATCTDLQGGFIQAHNNNQAPIPIPSASDREQTLLGALGRVLFTFGTGEFSARFEQLVNGLVYELFFPDDLHAADIRLFDACEHEHITRLATLQGATLQTEAEALAERIFSNSHPIYAMLFDLQALDVVRIIEARD